MLTPDEIRRRWQAALDASEPHNHFGEYWKRTEILDEAAWAIVYDALKAIANGTCSEPIEIARTIMDFILEGGE